jgi:glycyl-tRNA synthetase (class II)
MVKPLSEQLSDLSLHAKKAEDDLAAAKRETHDKVVVRRAQVRATTTQTVEKLQQDMKSAGGAVSSSLAALKAKVSADADALKTNVSQWKKELDAKRAENRADELELEASVAIDYAISAVEQAKMAAIDAVIGRLDAIDAKKA